MLPSNKIRLLLLAVSDLVVENLKLVTYTFNGAHKLSKFKEYYYNVEIKMQ